MPDKPFSSPPCYLPELDEQARDSEEWQRVRQWRKEQRQRLLAQRRELTEQQLATHGEKVRRHLADELQNERGRLAFYWPLPGEVDLRPFIIEHIAKGGSAALAVIARKEQPLEFWHWDATTPMEAGGVWDIPTPAERRVVIPDVVMVPLLGFDRCGHRLGHGGGYYDRTLAALCPGPLVIGVGHEAGRLETIHPQQHDVPMDRVVTEAGRERRTS